MARKRIRPTAEQLEQLKANPFVNDDFIIRVNERTDPNTFRRDVEGHLTPKEIRQEIEQPCRVYTSSEIRQRIGMLRNGAKALLLFIQQEIQPAKDYVIINPQRFNAENMYKTNSALTEGLADLSRYQFITPTLLQNVYWINPRMLFNGSRLNKYPNHVKPK